MVLRKWMLIPLVACATAILLPASALAQKFQEPTQDELRMTTDPMAPGAPAVYLYREEVTDNFAHYVSSHARIKVLTDLGKEWATVEVPYRPGYEGRPIVEGRTIHPDGSVYPLNVSETELVAAQQKAIHLHKLVFNLPNVTVGSVLEYRWTRPMTGTDLHFFEKLGEGDRQEALASLGSSELAWDTPEWDVQQTIFVHKAHFYYNPLNDLERNVIGGLVTHYVDGERASYIVFTQHLPAGSTVTKSPKLDFTLDIQNVPPIRAESNAPPLDATRYTVRFYWTPYVTAADYWEGEHKRWSKSIDDFASASDKLKSAAADLTAGASTPEAKARKLYDAVQLLENTDFTRARSDAERMQMHMKRELRKAADIWTEKSGTSDQIAALYLALARAAGLEAYAMQVADRNRRIFDPNFLSLYQLDSLLILLKLDGKDVYVDPGQKFCPFGQLSWTHLLVGGLSQASKAPTYTPPNLSKDSITAHAADLMLSADGSVTGTVKILMNGQAALNWRQLGLRIDIDQLKERFGADMRSLLPQGIAASVDQLEGLDTSNGYLSATMRVSGQLGSPTGKRMMVPAFFFSGAHAQFASDEKRETAVDLKFAEQVIDSVVYRLPAGFSIQSAPAPVQIPWPERAALVVKTQTSPSTIEIKRIFARAFVLLDPKEYPALRDYYQKLATSDQQPLVLTTESASTGN
jgi:Domain of Unknown Function with PDB structure (DUF3857)/Transglutaminase-like superfamily